MLHHSHTIDCIMSVKKNACVYIDPQINKFGLDAHDLMGKEDWRTQYIIPEDMKKFDIHCHKCFLTGQSTCIYHMVIPNEGLIEVEECATLVRDDSGVPFIIHISLENKKESRRKHVLHVMTRHEHFNSANQKHSDPKSSGGFKEKYY